MHVVPGLHAHLIAVLRCQNCRPRINCSTRMSSCIALQAGCSAIASLCHVIPAEALHSQHNALLVSLLPSLGHQHSKVRTCTLTALDTLVIKVLMQKKLSIKHCTVACTDLLICKPVTSGCQPMLQKLYTMRSCRPWLTAIPCMSNPVSKTYRCICLPQSCML